MSEYQYVAFRAIDRAVSDENLEYMRKQSSRADVTSWTFENEYHYGDFHGNVPEMLRRGYDLHLHYANFGVRKLVLRFPKGVPDPKTLRPYLVKRYLEFTNDKSDSGGCLTIEPYYDAGSLDELWEIEEYVDRLVPLRTEIMDGDLRPLYLAHLAVSLNGGKDWEEVLEAPVPAGLGTLTDAQNALAEFWGLSDALVAAAAKRSPPIEDQPASHNNDEKWVQAQSEAMKNRWLSQLMSDAGATARAEMLSKYRADRDVPTWPAMPPSRTIAQLVVDETAIAEEAKRTKGPASRSRAGRTTGEDGGKPRAHSERDRAIGRDGCDE